MLHRMSRSGTKVTPNVAWDRRVSCTSMPARTGMASRLIRSEGNSAVKFRTMGGASSDIWGAVTSCCCTAYSWRTMLIHPMPLPIHGRTAWVCLWNGV